MSLRLIRYSCMIFLLLMCMNNKKTRYKIKTTVMLSIVIIAALLNTFFFGGGTSLLFITVILISFRLIKIDSEKMFKATIKVLLASNLFIITLSCIGILEDIVRTRYVGMEIGGFFEGNYNRHTLGFLASNQIPLTLLIIYIMLIGYKKDKVPFAVNAIFLAVNAIFFKIFGSRIAYILLSLAILMYIIVNHVIKVRNKKHKVITKKNPFYWAIYPICFCVSIGTALIYDLESEKWRYINNIFMDRLRMSHTAINQYGISLFGKGLEVSRYMTGIENGTIDNGYVSLLLQRGIIICIIIMILWCRMTYLAEKNNNMYLLIGLVIIAILNLIDAHLSSYKVIPFFCVLLDESKSMLLLRPFRQKRLEKME